MEKNNIRIIAFEEEILKAIQEGNLESKLSSLRLKAVEIGVSQEDLATLIKQCQKRHERSQGATNIIFANKTLIFTCIIALWAIEWYGGMKAEWSIILILFTNFVSALAVTFLVAALIRKKI